MNKSMSILAAVSAFALSVDESGRPKYMPRQKRTQKIGRRRHNRFSCKATGGSYRARR